MNHVLGIDVGFSPSARTWAISSLSESQGVIFCQDPTFVASQAEVTTYLEGLDRHSITAIGFDAPVTPERLLTRPAHGRAIDARFSRGEFHGSRRGPQPSSIAVPHPGWDLYSTGMAFQDFLKALGWRVHVHGTAVKGPTAFEVIPKLTLTLVTPRAWIAEERPRKGNLRQIDNFLFDRAFNQDPAEREQVLAALFPTAQIHDSLRGEIHRVANHSRVGERHELIGGLVAGIQTLQVATADACIAGAVGAHEGYFLLPRLWHPDWERTWGNTVRPGDAVERLGLARPVPSA